MMSLALVLSACAKGEKTPDPTVAPASATTDSSAMSMSPSMPKMTGDADHDFLRMMSDHHRGLIAIVHMTVDKKDVGSSMADAKKLDAAQDKELDQMVSMLEKSYKDPYEPKTMAEHQSMVDDLTGKSGRDFDRGFYADVIKHHEEALTMIDAYMPNAKDAAVKRMAAEMKAAQSREIADFKGKLAKLGG
jgi:uncharacterized protein (DUF305 family)